MPNIDVRKLFGHEQPRPELPILFVEVAEDKKGVAFPKWEDLTKAVLSYGMGEFSSTKEARAEELAKLNELVQQHITMSSPLRGMEIHVAASNHRDHQEARKELEDILENTRQQLDGNVSRVTLGEYLPGKRHAGLGVLTPGEIFIKGVTIAKNDEWSQTGYRVSLHDDSIGEAEFASKEGANIALSKIAVTAHLQPHEVNTKHMKVRIGINQ